MEVLLDGDDDLMNRFAQVRLEEAGEDGRWTATLLSVEAPARREPGGAAAPRRSRYRNPAGAPARPGSRRRTRSWPREDPGAAGAARGPSRWTASVVGEIGPGLLLFVGVGKNDLDGGGGPARARALADKVANLRIFYDSEGKSNLSLLDTGGAALVISQFTLYADYRRGRRPSFSDAGPPGAGRSSGRRIPAGSRAAWASPRPRAASPPT